MSTMWRSRWAAVGAAVAITLGAGGIGIVDATKSSGERAVYTAIEPCRLLDTRSSQNIGRNTPLGAGEKYIVTAHGDNGNCTGIPNDTVALELNVTGLQATGVTYFTIWSGAGDLPIASHVNLAPGASPAPNSVTTELDGAQFAIYNNAATANVIVDIVGIYQDHNHDDRYYTETESDGRYYTKTEVDNKTWNSSDTTNEAGIASSFEGPDQILTGSASTVSSVDIRVPSDGYVVAQVTGKWHGLAAGVTDVGECAVTKGTTFPSGHSIRLNDGNGDADGYYRSFSGHFVLEMDAADNPLLFNFGQSLNLVCREIAGDVRVSNLQMSAVFYPTSYAPVGLILPFPDQAPPAAPLPDGAFETTP